MAINKIEFNIQKGGLKIPLPNEDHVSAMLFPDINAPVGFGTGVKGLEFGSIEQIETTGITETDPIYGIVHYHAKEFFRLAPNAKLFLVFDLDDPDDFMGITNGRVRMIGMQTDALTSDLANLQTLCTDLANRQSPCIGILGLTKETTFSDLSLQNAPQVAVVAAGSGSGTALDLATSLGLDCVPALGTMLGVLAFGAVNESASWINKFRIDGDGEFADVLFADGTTLASKTQADLEALDDKRYLFPLNYVGIAGTYFNDSYTAIAKTDDYSNIENNRVIQKAIRNVRAALLPELGSPVLVDPDTGKLSVSTIKYLESRGDAGLQDLDLNNEISGGRVRIDPDQNVVATSQIDVVIEIVPTGTARKFVIRIGLTPKITLP